MKPKPSPPLHAFPPIPPSFHAKKSQILAALNRSEEAYTDNSPKGTVDEGIRELIEEINGYEGLVTTSSCAGRVAVFVEGGRGGELLGAVEGEEGEEGEGNRADEEGAGKQKGVIKTTTKASVITTASPGGKGGGRWLYVSHDPITLPVTSPQTQPETLDDRGTEHQEYPYSTLFNLAAATSTDIITTMSSSSRTTTAPHPRLIHLTFSPLILHILCATLHHARPVLAAAINAGFRESGVQSLRHLDITELSSSSSSSPSSTGAGGVGVMVAIRTAGLGFETVVGVVREHEGREVLERIVGEEYLGLCVGVVNERFRWNEERRGRLRGELRRKMGRETVGGGLEWEDKEERKTRKREEGLERQRVGGAGQRSEGTGGAQGGRT